VDRKLGKRKIEVLRTEGQVPKLEESDQNSEPFGLPQRPKKL